MSDAATMEIARHFRIERVIAERGIKLRGRSSAWALPDLRGPRPLAINIKNSFGIAGAAAKAATQSRW